MIKNIYAIVVSYNPDISNLTNLIDSLYKQGVLTVIVDNNSSNISEIEDIFAHKIIKLNKNEGIAKAQNEGIKYALDKGAEYLMFFDQDSSISDSFINIIANDFVKLENNKSSEKIGAIGPRFIDKRDGFYYEAIKLNNWGIRKRIDTSNIDSPIQVDLLISSGTLAPSKVIKDVGLMKENYFIDYVDTEWSLRATSKGYLLYMSSSAIMEHAIGDKFIHLWRFKVPVHSAFRRYYRVRNAFYLLKESHVPKFLSIRDIVFNFIHQMILILCCKNKFSYVFSLFRGIKDGIKNFVK